MKFYLDHHRWGRVWKGPSESQDNLHYAYSDGELDPDGRLVWTQATTDRPYQTMTISEAEACALLLSRRWPNLESEGWNHEEACQVIGGILYGTSNVLYRQHRNTLDRAAYLAEAIESSGATDADNFIAAAKPIIERFLHHNT